MTLAPVRQILTIRHGSHLYGTSTPQSDTDFKGIHLPSGRNIILGRPEDVIDRGTNNTATKNTADDVDFQSYSLQKFLMMLTKGDTVATEMLFTPVVEFIDPVIWDEIYANRMKFLNRDCKGFVGYCVRQAAKYGIKGSRMNAVKKMIDYLAKLAAQDSNQPLNNWSISLARFCRAEDHMDFVNIPHPDGRSCWHIECCDRKMPLTTTPAQALAVYQKVWSEYGARARAAASNEGIDWKAVSHAVRVARQALELLQMGTITFPRPDAEELLAIKLGKLDYEGVVAPLLEDLVAQVQASDSVLPEKSDMAFIDEFVLDMYRKQL